MDCYIVILILLLLTMGLKGFYPLLKKTCAYVPDVVGLADLEGKTVAMDGDYFLYKAMHGTTSGTTFTAKDLATCVIRWLRAARNAGIMTIFVTSGGAPPVEKIQQCLAGRKRKRGRQEEKIQVLEEKIRASTCPIGDELVMRDQICRMKDAVRCIDPIMAVDVVRQVRDAGFECVESVSEADFMLVLLSEQGRCDYVATDDADILVSGAHRTLRGLVPLLSSGTSARVFTRADILSALGLTSAQLLELGCLLSCDYQAPISKVGPVTALRMIQAHGTIKAFLESDAFTSTKKKKPRYELPGMMTSDDYVRQTTRSIAIFQSRPDIL